MAPFMTVYNSGSRYFGKRSASKAEKAGVVSDGLRAQALPAAMAPACIKTRWMSAQLIPNNFVPKDQVIATWDN